MVYPLFIIGGRKFNFQTYYEYSINAKRVDILMKNGVRCIVIELKRNGNVEAALKQAFDYYADL